MPMMQAQYKLTARFKFGDSECLGLYAPLFGVMLSTAYAPEFQNSGA